MSCIPKQHAEERPWLLRRFKRPCSCHAVCEGEQSKMETKREAGSGMQDLVMAV